MSEYKPSKQSLLRDENKTLRTENARLTAELAKNIQEYNDEVDQFNAGVIAGEEGKLDRYMDDPYDGKFDVWRLGYEAGSFDRMTAELAELRERFEVTDDLLNQATVTIGAVIACCTYNSNEDAKIGIYGISPDAFTRIDQFITNYNRAVSAGKVSVDVKPIQRPADPSLEEDEFDSMPIEKINQYLREHRYNPEKVGLRGKILVEALTKNIIAREIIQRFLNKEGGCRFCEYDKYLPLDAPKNGHEEGCLYLAARAYLDNDTSTVVRRDLSDFEIEDLGAQEAESRGDK